MSLTRTEIACLDSSNQARKSDPPHPIDDRLLTGGFKIALKNDLPRTAE